MSDKQINVRLTHPGPDDLPIVMVGTADEIVTQMRALWNKYKGQETCECGKIHLYETNEAMMEEMLAAHAQHNNIIIGGYPKTHDRSAIAFLEVLQVAKQLKISGKGYKPMFDNVALPYTVGILVNQLLQRA